MERTEAIKNGLMGTGMFVDRAADDKVLQNEVDELHALNPITTQPAASIQQQMPSTVLHKAAARGHANHGWLNSYHSFSFANYYNPERMHFGVLRVLNDDCVDAGMGFGRHPHDNMEIISIPLEGALEHKDSMGNVAVIKKGDIQVMSAGTGIFHSEYNLSKAEQVKFLQIWLFPKTKNVSPRYDQLTLDVQDRQNKLQQVLSPEKADAGVWVNQDAWFHMGRFDMGFSLDYQLKKNGNGVYAFVLNGDFSVAGTELNTKDGLGIWDADQFSITSNSAGAEILLMEVPMSIQ